MSSVNHSITRSLLLSLRAKTVSMLSARKRTPKQTYTHTRTHTNIIRSLIMFKLTNKNPSTFLIKIAHDVQLNLHMLPPLSSQFGSWLVCCYWKCVCVVWHKSDFNGGYIICYDFARHEAKFSKLVMPTWIYILCKISTSHLMVRACVRAGVACCVCKCCVICLFIMCRHFKLLRKLLRKESNRSKSRRWIWNFIDI